MKFYAKGKVRDTAAMKVMLSRQSPSVEYGDFSRLLEEDDLFFLHSGPVKAPDAPPSSVAAVPFERLLETIERERYVLDEAQAAWVESLVVASRNVPAKPSEAWKAREPAKPTETTAFALTTPNTVAVNTPDNKPLAEGGNPLIKFG